MRKMLARSVFLATETMRTNPVLKIQVNKGCHWSRARRRAEEEKEEEEEEDQALAL